MSLLLYGIVAEAAPVEQAGAALLFIPGGGLAAAAAACAEAGQDVESVLAFGAAVERLHRQTTVIPVRYGTLMADAAAVAAHLEAMAGHYRRRLAQLENCEEMGIRLPMAKPAAADAPAPPAASGREYLSALKRKYSATEQAEKRAAELNLALAGLYREQRAETGLFNGETMYLSSYLVPRDKLAEFRAKLDALAASGNLNGLVSGPWPPYSFA